MVHKGATDLRFHIDQSVFSGVVYFKLCWKDIEGQECSMTGEGKDLPEAMFNCGSADVITERKDG